ncbi:MAG TPA: ABC transporter permease [Candidatus Limnocylindria bacterium]|jgi:NitT/TauT family transport system permease protein|nr:ABC transporter permease [Candidatus Limnocylindria bacterium]
MSDLAIPAIAAGRRPARRHVPIAPLVLPVVGLAIAIAAWWAVTGTQTAPMARSFTPDRALAALANLVTSGRILPHAASSLERILAGLALATAVGIPLGVLLARSRGAERTTSAVFQFLRMVSPLTWMPVAILALGIGDRPVVFLIFAAAVWPVVLSTAHGVSTIDPRWIAAARTLGAGGRTLVLRVFVPAALPDVLNGLRLALGVAWIVLVPAEMLGVRSGLGYFVLDTRDRFAYDELGALILAIGIVGFSLDLFLRLLRRRLAWDQNGGN